MEPKEPVVEKSKVSQMMEDPDFEKIWNELLPIDRKVEFTEGEASSFLRATRAIKDKLFNVQGLEHSVASDRELRRPKDNSLENRGDNSPEILKRIIVGDALIKKWHKIDAEADNLAQKQDMESIS